MQQLRFEDVEIRHFHLFCGLGGGAEGFNRGRAEVGNVRARFRCVGGIDNDPAACRDFTKRIGVKATCMDMFDRQQYIDFHGHEPPTGWCEAGPADMGETLLRSLAGETFMLSAMPVWVRPVAVALSVRTSDVR